MALKKPPHLGLRLLGAGGCLGLLLLWACLQLPCPIRALTGIICPACGMSRAWLAALRLDFAAAFACHPLFFLVPGAAWYILCAGTPFVSPRVNRWVGIGLVLSLILCYGIRLALFLMGKTVL